MSCNECERLKKQVEELKDENVVLWKGVEQDDEEKTALRSRLGQAEDVIKTVKENVNDPHAVFEAVASYVLLKPDGKKAVKSDE